MCGAQEMTVCPIAISNELLSWPEYWILVSTLYSIAHMFIHEYYFYKVNSGAVWLKGRNSPDMGGKWHIYFIYTASLFLSLLRIPREYNILFFLSSSKWSSDALGERYSKHLWRPRFYYLLENWWAPPSSSSIVAIVQVFLLSALSFNESKKKRKRETPRSVRHS